MNGEAAKRILLFPGQGSQYVGMARAIAEAHPAAALILRRAGDQLGYDLADIMFNGPEERLRQTRFTQPALFVASMMVMEALKEKGLAFNFAAGHSLGEYSALCAAEVFEFEAGLRLVKIRGELMDQAGERRPGAMAAILGLEPERVDGLVAEAADAGVVVAANYNSETQVVISGDKDAVAKTSRLAAEAGAKKVVPLPVSGAFHSPLMEYAVPGLRAGLEGVEFRRGRFPVFTNVEAEPESDPDRLRELLIRQLTSPVRWVECMRRARTLGCGEALEVGAGKVLTGLMRGISRDIRVIPVETLEDVGKLAS